MATEVKQRPRMIQLIRVYRDERVIHAEAYEHDEYPPQPEAHLRCRCIQVPVWYTRDRELTLSFKQDKVDVTAIYPTSKKRTT